MALVALSPFLVWAGAKWLSGPKGSPTRFDSRVRLHLLGAFAVVVVVPLAVYVLLFP